jgi:hypothetical protein
MHTDGPNLNLHTWPSRYIMALEPRSEVAHESVATLRLARQRLLGISFLVTIGAHLLIYLSRYLSPCLLIICRVDPYSIDTPSFLHGKSSNPEESLWGHRGARHLASAMGTLSLCFCANVDSKIHKCSSFRGHFGRGTRLCLFIVQASSLVKAMHFLLLIILGSIFHSGNFMLIGAYPILFTEAYLPHLAAMLVFTPK